MSRVDALVIAVADYALYAVAVGAAIGWLVAPRRVKAELAVAVVVGLTAALVAVLVTSALWFDPRPFVVDGRPPLIEHIADNGFPSDHTILATTVAGAVLAVRRRLGLVLLVVAVGLGASRVAAHVHHVPDIIGGVLLGLLCAALGTVASRRLVAAVARRRAAGSTPKP